MNLVKGDKIPLSTSERIIEYITYHGQARAYDLYKTLHISNVATHKQLRKLLEKNLLRKVGKPPFVFYLLPEEGISTLALNASLQNKSLPAELSSLIEENFLQITEDGEKLTGYRGFLLWVAKNKKNQDLLSLAREYAQIWTEKEGKKTQEGWFDATVSLKKVHKEAFVDYFLFEEVYSLHTFGRTKLARLVMHAKESSDKQLADEVSMMVKQKIEKVIVKYNIEAVAYIPPTIERPLQFMKELELQLHLPLPKIELIKAKAKEGSIQRSQKSIKDPLEKVINARDTIFLKNTQENPYSNVLLIDDAAASGASFNETARKLKYAGVGRQRIVSFSLVGNLDLSRYAVIRQI